jgi:hypothetical protein
MFALKPLSRDAVPAALARAERYRLLNESEEAESICRDVLAVDAENQNALVSLVLSLSDRLSHDRRVFNEALDLAGSMAGEYERAYYSGILWERRAKARYEEGGPGAGPITYDWMRRAMELFDEAEKLRPAGNDEALLRWNTCARFLDSHRDVYPAADERGAAIMLE